MHGPLSYHPPPSEVWSPVLHLATGRRRGKFSRNYTGRLISSISDYLRIRPAQRAVTVSVSAPCLGDYHSSLSSRLATNFIYTGTILTSDSQTIPVCIISVISGKTCSLGPWMRSFRSDLWPRADVDTLVSKSPDLLLAWWQDPGLMVSSGEHWPDFEDRPDHEKRMWVVTQCNTIIIKMWWISGLGGHD